MRWVLGSSACAGWPHPPTETASAYLQQALEIAYPGKKVEVINAAAHGFAAYRTRRVLDEVLKMEPDAVVVWEGNNEFLEERNYDPPGRIVADLSRHSRLVQWLRTKIAKRTQMSGDDLKGVAQFFWKKAHQQSLQLRQDPYQFSQVQEHFRESFQHMVSQSQRYEVPVLLCSVPVNLRDWLPTVSHNQLAGEQRESWQKLYNSARRSLLEGNYKDGVQTMRQAIAKEPEHAESYFWLGRLLEADGLKAEAFGAFSKARDLDYNPFRALSSFNEIIRTLAKENEGKGVYLADLDRAFADAAQHAAPGFDLFLDYVHPTKPGNLIAAQIAFDLIVRQNVLKSPPSVERFSYHEVPMYADGVPYRDETDIPMQTMELSVAALNHQYDTIVSKSEALVKNLSGHALTGADDPFLADCPAERCPPEFVERYRVFWNYVDVQRRKILNLPVTQTEEQAADRQVIEFYEKWYPLGRF